MIIRKIILGKGIICRRHLFLARPPCNSLRLNQLHLLQLRQLR
nr:MAG TPA: hypothetical protein [Caudoviricetes sp.]DAU40481.1 MAG TPA: hypothetical protein [Caudoviricetes sp.]